MLGNDTPDKERLRWIGEPKWSYLKRSTGNEICMASL